MKTPTGYAILAVSAIVVGLYLLATNVRFTIGERAQGGYPTPTREEQAELDIRAKIARDEANKAADGALKALEANRTAQEGARAARDGR